jgi:hypothetical protein
LNLSGHIALKKMIWPFKVIGVISVMLFRTTSTLSLIGHDEIGTVCTETNANCTEKYASNNTGYMK